MMMSTVVCSMLLVLICCLSLGPATTVSGQVQKVDMKVIQGGGGQCPSNEERERAINEIHQTVISSYNGICNGTTGWRRVAFINMTDTSHSCPPGLNMTTYSKRTCGRTHTGYLNCSSTTFSITGGLPYSQVCGRIRGYQYGVLLAFDSYIYHDQTSINSQYVDGISLTHGQSGERQHIWTFAAGLTQDIGHRSYQQCPCESSHYSYNLPPFVGNDYFCESGLQTAWLGGYYFHTLYSNNTLWDGQNCISSSTCCQFNSPPWFTKTLNVSTTDDIELRLCTQDEPSYGDVALELVELYVK